MHHALKIFPAKHTLRGVRAPQAIDAISMQNAAKTAHIEKVLRCRKCFNSGSATWESTPTGGLALLALSEGFHRRARVPLSLPPEIVCNCGMAQPEH